MTVCIRLGFCIAVGAASYALGTAARGQLAPGWTLTRVVDSATPLPGVGGIVSHFAPYTAMTDGAGAFFTTETGVYRWSDGVLEAVANTASPLPGFQAAMSEFGPPYASDGSVYFAAGGMVDGVPRRGVYRWHAGAISIVADTHTAAPHGGTFVDFLHGLPNAGVRGQFVSAHGGQVAFAAVEPDRTGMYITLSDGSITSAADSVTLFPGTSVRLRQFAWPSNEANDVAFVSFTPVGIYARINGQYSRFAASGSAPGGGNFGSGWGTPEVHAGTVIFLALVGTSGPGIYRWNGAGIELVLNRLSIMPGETGPLSDIPGFAFDKGRVAIVGTGATGDALFAQVNGQMHRIFDSAALLDGKVIDSLYIETTGFERRTLLFSAFFTDATIGMYIVQPSCPADWNIDGLTNSQDFFDFLGAWYGGC